MWNILIGAAFIVGGLSGSMVLVGTDSSMALVVVGAGLAVWGIVQIVRQKKSAAVANKE